MEIEEEQTILADSPPEPVHLSEENPILSELKNCHKFSLRYATLEPYKQKFVQDILHHKSFARMKNRRFKLEV
jgi:hypothetical protein